MTTMRVNTKTGSSDKLCKNPKDLYPGGKEWEHNLNGVKPARDFIYREGGANKLVIIGARCFGML